MIHLILGGQRSGKSRYAESLAAQFVDVSYIATAEIFDAEMQTRLEMHQQQRPKHWQTIEAPLDLVSAINHSQYNTVLIDCLTLWLSNALHYDTAQQWQQRKSAFIQCLQQSNKQIYLVSNEVGQGVIPDNALARQFVDQSGWLHQDIGKVAHYVTFVTAGFAQTLKAPLAN